MNKYENLPTIECIDCGEERTVLPNHVKTAKRCEKCASIANRASQTKAQAKWRANKKLKALGEE